MAVNAIDPIDVKVCGLTRVKDVAKVLSYGADYIGINRYAHSPRCVSPAQSCRLIKAVPVGKRVVVDVTPKIETLRRYQDEGFDYFQIHFDPETAPAQLSQWTDSVGSQRLWLAPRLLSRVPLPSTLLDYAETFLIDTYHKAGYGGSGQTGDWDAFAALQARYPHKTFILAGGLNTHNIQVVLAQSKARFIDVNSGVETAPGLKDGRKLLAFFQKLQNAAPSPVPTAHRLQPPR